MRHLNFACLSACIVALFWPIERVHGQTTVIRAAQMLGLETGEMIPNPVIVIQGDRIVQVGGRVPRDAEVIDLGGMTLLPGLIDLHTHLSGQIEPGWERLEVTESEADQALRAAYYAGRTLLAGFTTVRDMSGFAGVALERAIDRGMIDGPRIFSGAHSLGTTGGHCDVTGLARGVRETDFRRGIADGPAELLRAARYQMKHGARFLKICATAGVLSFESSVGAQQLSQGEVEAIVEEASRHGTHVAAHAHGTEGILAAVRAGVRTIEHGSVLTDEAIQLMIARGTYLVPTTYLVEAIDMGALPEPIRIKAESIMPIAVESTRRAVRAGVKIAFGTDAGVYPHGDNAKEFRALVDRGMRPFDAIRSATAIAAEVLGTRDRGRIESGMLADIIAVQGNPLDDITVMEDVRFVMKGGVVYKR